MIISEQDFNKLRDLEKEVYNCGVDGGESTTDAIEKLLEFEKSLGLKDRAVSDSLPMWIDKKLQDIPNFVFDYKEKLLSKLLSPAQKIKKNILEWARSDKFLNQGNNEDIVISETIDVSNVDEEWQKLVDADIHWEYVSETRSSGIDTDIQPEYSRHYESKSVAMETDDGWVGWTYWYGGGKHGEPEAIPWIDEAYDLEVTEEQKIVNVRTFVKK